MTRLRERIRLLLPPVLLRALINARARWGWLRVQTPFFHLFGPQYRRSRTLVEIDVTWACNLRCFNCNRSCEQAPTQESVTLDQVQRFIKDSISRGLVWERIRVLGGEPTLHPQLLDILNALRDWRDQHAPNTRLELVTNGLGPKVQGVLATVPDDILIENTAKESRNQPFTAFNVAPIDLPIYRFADFRSGCGVTTHCGIGLTPRGWYPCAVAGGIDRILNLGMGRDLPPEPDDDMLDQLSAFCRVCGHFDRLPRQPVTEPMMSPTWRHAYERHGTERAESRRTKDHRRT